MNITEKWLEKNRACSGGRDWWRAQTETNGVKVVKKLIVDKQLEWANWLVVRLMGRKDKIRYAIFAAEQVLEIFEKRYPDDKRPREAIEAARKVLVRNTAKNRTAAYAAADAAAAAYADAAAGAYAAAYAAYAMKTRIINYGIGLLKGAK